MPETIVASPEQQVTPPVPPTPEVPKAEVLPVQQESLVTRVAKFKPESVQEQPTQSEPEFDFKDLDKVKTPEEAKTYAEKAYKSMQSGWNKKFQEVAELRKTLEQSANQQKSWTPQKIQELLNDPTFVQAAQTVAQTQVPSSYQGTQEQWSSLSETDKVKFQQMDREIQQLKQQSQFQIVKQQDEQLKGKYPHYNSESMDILTNEILAGKKQITREDVFRSMDYEDGIRRAYELGKRDAGQENKEKTSSVSIEGVTMQGQREVVQPVKGESDKEYFKRIVLDNISRLRAQKK